MRRGAFKPAVLLILTSLGALLLAACGSVSGGPLGGEPSMPTTSSAPGVTRAQISATALPLGDGHVSTSPKTGYVDSCMTQFGGGGAFVVGPWIHGATWDSTAKLAVQGAVSWPRATYSAQIEGAQRLITTEDAPVGFTTGVFPIRPSDPAFAYDRNPNTIIMRSLRIALPANPNLAAQPTCLNMGAIGVLSDGVLLFNALDGEGRDAVAHEVLDQCGGHPERTGEYHHHDAPPCLLAKAKGASTLVGYALDGFGIYVERDANGNLLTNADLDTCHGRTSVVTWDGKQISMYHYVATAEYPYTLGCFMGAPARVPGS